jgi:hypothetical protein
MVGAIVVGVLGLAILASGLTEGSVALVVVGALGVAASGFRLLIVSLGRRAYDRRADSSSQVKERK